MRYNSTLPSKVFLCFLLLISILGYNEIQAGIECSGISYINVKKPFTVVIDAGHGGKDSGTLGKKSMEKDIALSIALKLGKKIEDQYKDVDVIYTRKDDTFIPLFERINIANKVQADVFISIHCNASSRTSAKGTETFVMGLHKAEENLETAKRENSVILLESDFETNYDGFDPNSDAGHIILSMYQNLYLDQSIEFASLVEKEFGIKTSRGVKQAGFVVLRRATMPAILIETGFLSNPDDEKRLLSNKGQEKITKSLFKAFSRYKAAKEGPEIDIVKEEEKKIEKNETGKEFRIQIAAKKELKAELFTNVEGMEIFKEGDLYKYVTRSYSTRKRAQEVKEFLQSVGYKEAFIVVYSKDRQRISEK
jgi:N-acetylmuramoyl-L-alanine amidase